eukprot:755716-Hanusia_phi.AAC.6
MVVPSAMGSVKGTPHSMTWTWVSLVRRKYTERRGKFARTTHTTGRRHQGEECTMDITHDPHQRLLLPGQA